MDNIEDNKLDKQQTPIITQKRDIPKKTTKKRRLTIKQKKFVENYIKTGNGQESAKQAGYDVKNDNMARVIASTNIIKDNIKAEIDKRTAQIEQKTNITVDFIRSEHLRLQHLAESKGDLSNATANLAYTGKTIGCYADTLNTNDVSKAQELSKCSADEALELKRIANIRLAEMSRVKTG